MSGMPTEWRQTVLHPLEEGTDSSVTTGGCWTLLIRKLLLLLLLLLGALPATSGTLSECGWRGTRTLRCYEETNGVFGYQQGEDPYWDGGVEQMERERLKETTP